MSIKKYGGTLLATERDEWGLIEVVDFADQRSLFFGEPIEQGRLYKFDPQEPGFEYMKRVVAYVRQHPQAKRVLMLGLGAGRMLAPLLKSPGLVQLHVVELRPKVVAVVKRYFVWPEDGRIQLTLAEACQWLSENTQSYDVIIVDLFDAQQTPDCVGKMAFFENLRQSLSPKGWVIGNFWMSEFAPLAAFNLVFADALRLDEPLTATGNWIAVAQLPS